MNDQDFKLIPFLKSVPVTDEPPEIVWQAGISLVAYGVRIGVRVNKIEHFAKVFRYFPPFWKLSTDPQVDHLFSIVAADECREKNILYWNGAESNSAADADWLISNLEPRVRLVVGEFAVRRVFVHAGVVGWKGRAIIIPAQSNQGKSTLVREFVKLGAVYYSDEFAVIDAAGRIHPYPKLISIREKWAAEGKQIDYPIEAFGGKQGKKPLILGKVLLTEFTSGKVRQLHELSQGSGILELLRHTISTQNNPARTLLYLQIATKNAEFWQGKRGEAVEFARQILFSGK